MDRKIKDHSEDIDKLVENISNLEGTLIAEVVYKSRYVKDKPEIDYFILIPEGIECMRDALIRDDAKHLSAYVRNRDQLIEAVARMWHYCEGAIENKLFGYSCGIADKGKRMERRKKRMMKKLYRKDKLEIDIPEVDRLIIEFLEKHRDSREAGRIFDLVQRKKRVRRSP